MNNGVALMNTTWIEIARAGDYDALEAAIMRDETLERLFNEYAAEYGMHPDDDCEYLLGLVMGHLQNDL